MTPERWPALPYGAWKDTYATYSHEVISHGFWPGSAQVAKPAFYAYVVPEPQGFKDASVQPDGAYYHRELGEFILPYEAVRSAVSPERAITEFVDSTSKPCWRVRGWSKSGFRQPQRKRQFCLFFLKVRIYASRVGAQGLDRRLELVQVSFHDTPHQRKIHTEVAVRQTIAHAGDLLPRDLRATLLRGARELLDGLANDLELANDGVLAHALGHESVAAHRRVFFNVLDCVVNVTR